MYIVPIAWFYVATLMAIAEATNTNGTVLGGLITFVMYGLLPIALVIYLMGTPSRRRLLKRQEKEELMQQQSQTVSATISSSKPNASGHTTSESISSVGKEV
tara:strand:+ start:426 stop:731 length:306 start_codon:yes stop_codon:yes gene_type:complete